MKNIVLRALAAALLLAPAAAQAGEWVLDTTHSSITFRIGYLVSKVGGSFGKFEGTIEFDPAKPAAGKTMATISAGSINTNNTDRDAHLRSDEMMKVDAFPAITFVSTAWKSLGNDKFEITGDLTMLGVTKPVTIAATYLGASKNRRGVTVAAFQGTTSLDRTEWGFTYGYPTPLGKDVEVTLDILAAAK